MWRTLSVDSWEFNASNEYSTGIYFFFLDTTFIWKGLPNASQIIRKKRNSFWRLLDQSQVSNQFSQHRATSLPNT